MRLVRVVAAAATVSVVAATGCSDEGFGANATPKEGPSTLVPEADSDEANALLEQLRARYTRNVAQVDPEDPATRFQAAKRIVRREAVLGANDGVRWGGSPNTGRFSGIFDAETPARIASSIGRHSAAGFNLRDERAKMAIGVAIRNIEDVPVELAKGYAIYRDVKDGSHLIERVYADGVEDFLTLDGPQPSSQPGSEHRSEPRSEIERSEIEYEVALTEGVFGVRLVADTFELLDSDAAPRLRMSPPFVVDANGETRSAHVSVAGCRFDTSPAAPWGRPLVAPESETCRVTVRWDSRGLAYPAIVDPSWITTGSMAQARSEHTASTLFTGHVLVAGGLAGSSGFTSVELYDSVSGTWAATGSMQFPRWAHTSNTLPSGDVLVAGGFSSPTFATVEVYRPYTGLWTQKASMLGGREGHASRVTAEGKLIVTGGLDSAYAYLTSGEIYDPLQDTWSAIANMGTPRAGHTLDVLQGGRIIAVGGTSASAVYTSAVETFSPSTGTWTAAPALLAARAFHTTTALRDGRLLVVGGYGSGAFLGSAELFAPATQTWTSTTTTLVARNGHTATRLPSGDVLIAGGANSTGPLGTGYRFLSEPTGSSSWQHAAVLQAARKGHTASALPNGNVLVAGGEAGSQFLATSELFTEAGPGDVCVGGGYIRGTAAPGPAAVNLTLQGGRGWAKWGFPTVTSYIHDDDEGPFISGVTLTSATATVAGAAPTLSWNNGTPIASASTSAGLSIQGLMTGSASFTAPADLAQTTLKIYLGSTAPATLRLSLPTTNCGTVQIPINGSNVEVTVKYAGTMDGQSLVASLKDNCSPAGGCTTRLFLRGATIQRELPRTLMQITGLDAMTAGGAQSETSIAVSHAPRQGIAIAYNNDINDGYSIEYGETTRKISRGTTLAGWAWSTNPAGGWINTHLTTSPAWPLLWGDPAVAASRQKQDEMYLSNLAMSETRFLEKDTDAGQIEGPINSGSLDGACIFRSKNHGQNFSPWYCGSSNGHNVGGDFWDGASMETGSDGGIYVAYWNFTQKRIDVLRGTSEPTANFALLPSPFGSTQMQSHPRLRYDARRSRLYVAAMTGAGNLLVAFRPDGGNWSPAVDVGSGIANAMTPISFGTRKVRIGETFTFDVGANELQNQAARFFIVDSLGGQFKLKSRVCSAELTNCADGPWSFDRPGEEAFQPVVRSSPPPGDGDWFLSWYARAGAYIYWDSLMIHGARLNGQAAVTFTVADRGGAHTPCPATLTTYWSDYEDVQYVDGGWLRTSANSRPACTKEWAFISYPIRVEAEYFWLMDRGPALNPVHD